MANDSIFTIFDTASISCTLMEILSITTLGLLTEIFFAIALGVQFWEIGLTSQVIKIIISINE